MRRTIAAALLLALLTTVVYLPVGGHDFINFDDGPYVAENPRVLAGLTAEGAGWAFTSFHAANWHPLTWLSLMLDVELFGPGPGAIHLVNVALHVVAGVLLLVAVAGLTGRLWGAFAVAGLFLLHPLHVESVAWIAERKDLLSAVFFMLTLLAWTKYVRSEIRGHDQTGIPGHDPNSGSSEMGIVSRETRGHDPNSGLSEMGIVSPGTGWYGVSLVFFALGLMAKPMLVTLPFLLLLLDWWPLGRLRAATGEPGKIGWRNLRPLVLEKIPFLLLSCASSVVTYLAQSAGGSVSSTEMLGLGARLVNALAAAATYLLMTVWPANLAVIYPHPGGGIPWWRAAAAGIALVAITATAVRLRLRRPYLAAGWLWYLGMLVPVLGLVQVGTQSMADRYTYLPLTGVFVAAAWLAGDWATGRGRRLAVRWMTFLVLVVAASLSARQVGHWKNGVTLFTRTLAVTERNVLAHNNLGNALMAAGDLPGALRQFEAVLLFDPANAGIRYNMALALEKLGREEEALAHYDAAVRHDPKRVEARNNLGILLARRGRNEEARREFQETLRLKPDHAGARFNLGMVLEAQGDRRGAEAEYRAAIALRPEDVDARDRLAELLLGQGRAAEALEHRERVVSLRPASSGARNNMGVALALLGRIDEARPLFAEAVRLDPGNLEARRNLARATGPPPP